MVDSKPVVSTIGFFDLAHRSSDQRIGVER